MNKKLIVMVGMAVLSCGAFAHGFGHRGWHPGPRPMHHGHYHHCGWGRGGSHFWPGFVGGVVGGVVGTAITRSVYTPDTVVVSSPTVVTTPTVVTQPVVVQQPVITQPVVTQPVVVQQPVVQNVWVEGRYVDQVQANGTVVRVWQPGHYEQR